MAAPAVLTIPCFDSPENGTVCRARSGRVAACVWVIGCASPGLQAQEEIEQVLVTARKRVEQVWQVPFSVDVQTRSQLADKRATDGMSALRDAGGAGMTTFGDRSNAFVVIRGVAPVLAPL